MKVIFMGTPHFSVQALTEIVKAGHVVVAVYTQPPRPSGRGQKEHLSPIHEAALEYGIPVFTPKTLKDIIVQKQFAALNADITIVVAYGLLLPKAILETCRCINIHASLLPRWRGAAPIQRAIMAGDKKTGITIMDMDEGLDTGDVLMTQEVYIMPDMTAGHLHDQLSGVGAKLIVKALEKLGKNEITPAKQEGEATYAEKIQKDESKINWKQSGKQILLNVHAFNPYPGMYFEYKGEKIKIFEADFIRTTELQVAGTVLDENFTISCIDGRISPVLVQRQGKNVMPIKQLLLGFKVEPGVKV